MASGCSLNATLRSTSQACCMRAIVVFLLGSVAVAARNLNLEDNLPSLSASDPSQSGQHNGSDFEQLTSERGRQLWERRYNLRLCTGAPITAPFVQGVYLAGGTVARITVFDVEVMHFIKAGTTEWDVFASAFVNVLAFFESHGSIHHSQWEHRALAVQSGLGERVQLRCTYFSGKDPESQDILHEADAKLLHVEFQRFLNIHCPLPSEQWKRQENLRLRLSLQEGDTGILHLEPLPICRDDGSIKRRHALPRPVGSKPLASLPQVEYPAVKREVGSDKDGTVSPRAEKTTVALCVRPYHDHHFFSTKKLAKSDERLLEWINYHLLIGVHRIYFYERYGSDKLELLQAYIDRGLVVHIPFPVWSEVFYRKERFSDAKYPYNFPLIYDQVLVYEHCIMQGRRNYDTWMFFTDTDEFLWYANTSVGYLPKYMEDLTEDYEKKNKPRTVGAVSIKRYNYWGANESGIPVLEECSARCEGPIYNLVYREDGTPKEIKYKDKMGSQPGQMMGSIIDVHEINGPAAERLVWVDQRELRINHYSSAPFSEYKGELGTAVASPCNKVYDPWQLDLDFVHDTTLDWAVDRMTKCTAPNGCSRYTKGECGFLCPLVDS